MSKKLISFFIICFTFLSILSFTKVNGTTTKIEDNVFRGKIVQIKAVLNYDSSESKTEKIIKLSNQFDQKIEFLLTLDTLGIKDLKNSDSVVIVYKDSNKPDGILVADAVVHDYGYKVVKTDVFTDSSLNKDGTLKLATDRTTTVVTINNELFTGDLSNKKVVIFYDQKDIANSEVLAKKIVVLQNQIDPNIVNNDSLTIVSDIYFANLSKEEKDKFNANINLSNVFINFEPVNDIKVNNEIGGNTLICLKPVCQKLNINYNYNNQSGMFGVNDNYFGFITSKTISTHGKIITLNHPSVLIDNEVYVPLDFFTKVLNKLAYTKNDKVLIYDYK